MYKITQKISCDVWDMYEWKRSNPEKSNFAKQLLENMQHNRLKSMGGTFLFLEGKTKNKRNLLTDRSI